MSAEPTIDTALLFVKAKAQHVGFTEATRKILPTIVGWMENEAGDSRLALIRLESNDTAQIPTVYPFTGSTAEFELWLSAPEPPAQSSTFDEHRAICELIRSERLLMLLLLFF